MKPKPWSFSALEAFKNCPRQYHAVRVERRFEETKGPQTIWGEEVHKHFEERLKHGVVLPAELTMHEAMLASLQSLPGQEFVELEAALNLRLQSCGYWDPDVWWRGKIDYLKVNGDKARVIDWKTGKKHQKLQQLYLFMLWTFIAFPKVQVVHAQFYWTQTQSFEGVTYGRERMKNTWEMFLPDLRQYADAFHSDIWQPRPSGLCKRHCGVVDCEFNGLGGSR